jgi:hypothetical protein
LFRRRRGGEPLSSSWPPFVQEMTRWGTTPLLVVSAVFSDHDEEGDSPLRHVRSHFEQGQATRSSTVARNGSRMGSAPTTTHPTTISSNGRLPGHWLLLKMEAGFHTHTHLTNGQPPLLIR